MLGCSRGHGGKTGLCYTISASSSAISIARNDERLEVTIRATSGATMFDDQASKIGKYEESIPARDNRRGHRARRYTSARNAKAMGENGCGADDGALFGDARHGLRPTQYTASLRWKADWPVLQIRLYEREAIFAEQPHGPETRGVGSAGFSTRTGATQAKGSPVS
jgi:hypothetical protein